MRSARLFILGMTILLAACGTGRDLQQQTGRPGDDLRAVERQDCNAPFEFIVVQLNDVYEVSPLDGGRVGGMARVATVLRHLREKNTNTIAVHAGDFLSPSLIGSLKKAVGDKSVPIAGEQMVAVMNAVGIDYVTFGNHEFDVSQSSLQSRLNESRFAYISANVRQSDMRPFEQISVERTRSVPEYVIHTFARPGCSDIRLGMFSVTLPFNRKGYVQYEDVYSAGQRAFNEARTRSDLVFALTHLTLDMDKKLAGRIPELPLIMGGHEHEDIEVVVGRTHITKADANARTVYIHWATYHPGSGHVGIWSQLMPITGDIKADAGVESLVRHWEQIANDSIGAMGYEPNEAIAQFAEPYDGREASVRNKATKLGRAIACAILAEDSAATLALLNSGSIRIDDMLVGSINQRDVLRVLPFGGGIVHASLPGHVLQRVLEIGSSQNAGEGGYLQTTPNVELRGNKFFIDGAALLESKTYEVALPIFLSEGKESNLGFMGNAQWYRSLTLTGVDGREKNDLRDVMIKYLKSKPDNWQACAN